MSSTTTESPLPPFGQAGWAGARLGRAARIAWRKIKAPIVRARGKRLPGPAEMEALRQRLAAKDQRPRPTAEQLAELQAKYAKGGRDGHRCEKSKS